MVSYGEAMKKPFSDVKNLIIGIILSIIPIVNSTIVTGFAIESSGLSKTRPSKKMPEWKNWGHLFVQGLSAIVVQIIYLIPAILVLLVGFGLAIGDISSVLLGQVATPEVIDQIEAGEITDAQIQQMFGENWYLMLPSILRVAPILIVGFILALVATFLTPIAVLNSAKKKRFSAAFELGTVIQKALTGKYVLAWLVVIVIGIILSAVLDFVPIVGPAISMFVIGVIGYSLYGQVYKEV